MKRIISIMILFFIVVSCKYFRVVSGTVIDKTTHKPLANIVVYDKEDKVNKTITDSIGNFELGGTATSVFGCPPMTIVIESPGYAPTEVKISAEGNTIELEKKTAN